jgi:hypothetical protein
MLAGGERAPRDRVPKAIRELICDLYSLFQKKRKDMMY